MSEPASGRSLQVAEIAQLLEADFRGDGDCLIESLASLSGAGPCSICFISNAKYLVDLAACRAGAVLMRAGDAASCDRTVILVDNPYLAYAKVSQWLHGAAPSQGGIHPTAVVMEGAEVCATAEIGPHVVIEAGASIGAEAVIGAGCYIGTGAKIGAGTRLAPRVTVLHGCEIGQHCRVLSASVIGADGFGFAPERGKGWQRIEQVGAVRIGDRVEIGACTTVDRGALDDTVIEDGVIIDNHVQIAHNVHIGKYTAIAGCVGIAGSTRIGQNCQLGGGSSVVGHLQLDDGVVVFANTFVTSSLKAGVYASATAAQPVADWRRNQPNLRQFHQLAKRMRQVFVKVCSDQNTTANSSE